ncbi:hypothetical protein D3C75_1167170 [compost metagenome]
MNPGCQALLVPQDDVFGVICGAVINYNDFELAGIKVLTNTAVDGLLQVSSPVMRTYGNSRFHSLRSVSLKYIYKSMNLNN